MNNLPLVSTIIPTYNSNHSFLEKAISSIHHQTYSNKELIIVDDFSTDPTLKNKLLSLQKKYSFKLIFLKKNSGSAAVPLNEGIKAAQGKYIAICGHDDYYLPTKLATQTEFLEKNKQFMMAYSRGYNLYENNGRLQKIKLGCCRSGWVFSSLILQRFYILPMSTMIRKGAFETVGFFDNELYIEDWDMWLRIAKKFQIGFIDKHLHVSRLHDHNMSKNFPAMSLSRKRILDKWSNEPEFSAACAINHLIEGPYTFPRLFPLLLKETWLHLLYIKNPYRTLRLFVKNLLPYKRP